MLAYQTWNALAWRIGGRIGDWMIRYDGAAGRNVRRIARR